MKSDIVRTILIATLLLSLAEAASAQSEGVCTNGSMAGAWGYIQTGTIIQPTGAVPFAAVGRLTFDWSGNFSGTMTRSVNGVVSRVVVKGTYKVNPDCTGTLAVGAYDQSGNLLYAVTVDLVLVGNGKEHSEVYTSLLRPDGVSVPVVITVQAKKLFPLEWPWY